MSVIKKSLFFTLVVTVWSPPYATFTAALPLGSGNNMKVAIGQNHFFYDPDFFKGDIVITPEQYKMYYEDDNSDASNEPEHVS